QKFNGLLEHGSHRERNPIRRGHRAFFDRLWGVVGFDDQVEKKLTTRSEHLKCPNISALEWVSDRNPAIQGYILQNYEIGVNGPQPTTQTICRSVSRESRQKFICVFPRAQHPQRSNLEVRQDCTKTAQMVPIAMRSNNVID